MELKDNDNNKDSWFLKKDLRDLKVKDFTLGQETENGKKLDEEITAEEPIVEEITAEELVRADAEEPIVEEITSDNLNNPQNLNLDTIGNLRSFPKDSGYIFLLQE